MMVATGEQVGLRRRAEDGGGVVVVQAAGGETVEVGRVDGEAEVTQLGELGVVHDRDDAVRGVRLGMFDSGNPGSRRSPLGR